jgi:hypothetical protein
MPRGKVSPGGIDGDGDGDGDGDVAGAGAGTTAGVIGTDTTGAGTETGADPQGDTDAHAASVPTIAATKGLNDMWLILLEALGALAILVFIVWWTMFAGRNKGERPNDEA